MGDPENPPDDRFVDYRVENRTVGVSDDLAVADCFLLHDILAAQACFTQCLAGVGMSGSWLCRRDFPDHEAGAVELAALACRGKTLDSSLRCRLSVFRFQYRIYFVGNTDCAIFDQYGGISW